MNFNLDTATIYLARHGSHAYGLNIETSDEDYKGICIPPLDFELGFLHNFEQHEEMVANGHPADKTIYSLKKFAKLAAACNPNIIEMLFCDRADILSITREGERLRAAKNLFLSKQAFASFSGYALSQRKHVEARGLDDVRARKNAMHFVRLSRMCLELMRDGEVNVKRKDREELLAIRRGERSMESILAEVDDLYVQALAARMHSSLPEKPDYEALNGLVVALAKDFYERYEC